MNALTAAQQGRRRAHLADLVSLIGDESAMQALNLIDQAGIEQEDVRGDVIDALLSSIRKGQEWATGETAIAVTKCAVCEGSCFSRSGRGRCRACRGFGRTQVKCRECAELNGLERHRSRCYACAGAGQLDPVTQRELILRQHAEWWRKTMETRAKGEENGQRVVPEHEDPHTRPMSVQEIIDGCRSYAARDDVTRAQRGRSATVWALAAPPGEPRAHGVIDTIFYSDSFDGWLVRLRDDNGHNGSYRAAEVFVDDGPRQCTMPGPGSPACIQDDCPVHGAMNQGAPSAAAIYEAARDARVQDHVRASSGPMPATIARSLVRAQKHIRMVPKSSENPGDGYEYTSAEVIVDEARTALHQEGLAVVLYDWDVLEHEVDDEIRVTFLLVHESGEQHVCRPVRMPIVVDSGREKRAPDKALATALTYATSQWLRTLLQIPRIGRSEDADARSDVGDGGRRRARKDEADRAPLSSELNDAVVSMYKAIEGAKTAKALDGIAARLEKETTLPSAVAEKIRAALTSKRAEIEGGGA